jgi:hypothetical protein
MSENRLRQRLAFAKFQEKKLRQKNELETRLNTLIYYSSGDVRDNNSMLLQENEILRRQCDKLERDNNLMKSKALPTPLRAKLSEYLQVPQAPVPKPGRISTLTVPSSNPMILTPETALAKDILEILHTYSNKNS